MAREKRIERPHDTSVRISDRHWRAWREHLRGREKLAAMTEDGIELALKRRGLKLPP